jgi:hypothetical protein
MSVKSDQSPWQFSLRALLLATAIVSAILAIAVNAPMLFAVTAMAVFAGAIVQGIGMGMTYATSEKRPLLATVSWIAFTLFFFAVGYAFLNAQLLVPGYAFFCCGIISIFRAMLAILLALKRND